MLARTRASMLGIPIPDDPPVTTAIGRELFSLSLMLTYDANLLDFFRVSRTSSAVDFLPRRAAVTGGTMPNDCEEPISSESINTIVLRSLFMPKVSAVSQVDRLSVRNEVKSMS